MDQFQSNVGLGERFERYSMGDAPDMTSATCMVAG